MAFNCNADIAFFLAQLPQELPPMEQAWADPAVAKANTNKAPTAIQRQCLRIWVETRVVET
jgi:hypothetical protein